MGNYYRRSYSRGANRHRRSVYACLPEDRRLFTLPLFPYHKSTEEDHERREREAALRRRLYLIEDRARRLER